MRICISIRARTGREERDCLPAVDQVANDLAKVPVPLDVRLTDHDPPACSGRGAVYTSAKWYPVAG